MLKKSGNWTPISVINISLNNLIVKWNLNRKLASKLVIVFVAAIVDALIPRYQFVATHNFASAVHVRRLHGLRMH